MSHALPSPSPLALHRILTGIRGRLVSPGTRRGGLAEDRGRSRAQRPNDDAPRGQRHRQAPGPPGTSEALYRHRSDRRETPAASSDRTQPAVGPMTRSDRLVRLRIVVFGCLGVVGVLGYGLAQINGMGLNTSIVRTTFSCFVGALSL